MQKSTNRKKSRELRAYTVPCWYDHQDVRSCHR